jgi:hypothetical protein
MDEFVTLDELAAYLSPRAPRDLADDALAAMAVAGAAERIQSETGQEIAADESTATFAIGAYDRYVRSVILPEHPVVTVDEVRDDGEVSLDWQLHSGGIVRLTEGYFTRDALVEVDYTHGYDPVPADLRLLAVTLAARAYQQGLARQESAGSSSVTYSVSSSLDLSAGEKALLAKYRMRVPPTVEGVPVVT